MYGSTFAQENPRNTATAIVTARPQPSVIFVYPPFTISPGAPLPNSTTMATTPFPNKIKTNVPMNSAESSAANVGFLSMAGDSTTTGRRNVLRWTNSMSRVLVLAAIAAGFWSTASGQSRWVDDGHTTPRI